jgi:hypothetical protein
MHSTTPSTVSSSRRKADGVGTWLSCGNQTVCARYQKLMLQLDLLLASLTPCIVDTNSDVTMLYIV